MTPENQHCPPDEGDTLKCSVRAKMGKCPKRFGQNCMYLTSGIIALGALESRFVGI